MCFRLKNVWNALKSHCQRGLVILWMVVMISLVGLTSACGGGDSSTTVGVAPPPDDQMFGPDPATVSQVDRMGLPALLTVFIPPNPFEPSPPAPALEDAFNQEIPSRDQQLFRGEIVNTLEILFSLNDEAGDDPSDDAATIQVLADVLLPDVLTVQLNEPTAFLNGRNLEDDVIDAELGLITEGACTTDFTDNDSIFLSSFPYLGIPN